MKVHGMKLVWYRPHPKGWTESNSPPDEPSKIQHVFGGPNGPQSLCGKWTVWCPPKISQSANARFAGKTVTRCDACRRLLDRLRQKPAFITLPFSGGRTRFLRTNKYQLY